MIELHTAATPNGHKVSVALEELALPYTVHEVDLAAGQQKTPAFLLRNPNGRIPVIVDRDAEDFVVFESGAILLYLAEKTGRLSPADARGRSRVIQWLMFQMAGVGPMMGQANVYFRYLPEKTRIAMVLGAHAPLVGRVGGGPAAPAALARRDESAPGLPARHRGATQGGQRAGRRAGCARLCRARAADGAALKQALTST